MHRHNSQVTVHYVASTTFTLDKSYADLKPIGRGSYGVVCSAFSSKLNKKVAIKKITPVSKHTYDAKHVLREIMLMRHMGKHENIITLEDLVYRERNDELYIVMELLDSDLHRILQSKQSLTESHYKYFLFQLLCGVKYLHDNKIIHRDLKPGNLLVSKDCKLRITDFGLARERPDNIEDGPMTEHVVTRWYRSPELMLCPDGLYSYPVDIWSCGCILAEMLGRSPLFPGKTFIHQLSLVFDVIGSPQEQDVRHIVNAEARSFLQSQQGKRKTPFSSLYPTAESNAWKLLDQFLQFNPDKRITVDDALQSPYLHGVGTAVSLVFPDTSPDFVFDFETADLTRTQLRQLICDEIASFRREKFPRTDRAAAPALRGKKSSSLRSASGAADAELFDTDDVSSLAAAKDEETASLHKHNHTNDPRDLARKDQQPTNINNNTNREHGTRRKSSLLRREDKPALSPPPPQPVDEAPAKSYMRGTRNFKSSRAASAPRARPQAADVLERGAAQRREDKYGDEIGEDGSVHHLRAGKSMRLEPSRNERNDANNVGIGIASGINPVNPARNNAIHADYSGEVADCKRDASDEGSSAVRQSTIRNMLNMCDELYYGTPLEAPISSAAAKRDKATTASDEKNSEFVSHGSDPRRSRAYDSEYNADSKLSSDLLPAVADRTSSLRDSKEVWSSALYHTTQSDGNGMSSPARKIRVSSIGTPRVEASADEDAKPLQQPQQRGQAGTRSSYEHKLEDYHDNVQATHYTAEPKRYAAQNNLADPAHFTSSSSSARRAVLSGASSDSEEEPTPRSPPRKSILATYTSPKRLGAASNNGQLGSPGGSPVRPFPVRDHAPVAPSVPGLIPTGNSLVDKLLERAQRLNMAYDTAPVPAAAALAASTGSRSAAARAYAGVGSELDEDSSVGSNAPIYPESDSALSQARGESARATVPPTSEAARAVASEGIAAMQDRRAAAPAERQAPPIIPPPPDKKKFTVAKSPKFSQMSWQRRLNEQREAQEKLLREQEEEEHRRKTKATTKPANGNYFGYQAPKRSDSAPRPRR